VNAGVAGRDFGDIVFDKSPPPITLEVGEVTYSRLACTYTCSNESPIIHNWAVHWIFDREDDTIDSRSPESTSTP
jgi:hypothetical protein